MDLPALRRSLTVSRQTREMSENDCCIYPLGPTVIASLSICVAIASYTWKGALTNTDSR